MFIYKPLSYGSEINRMFRSKLRKSLAHFKWRELSKIFALSNIFKIPTFK